MASAKASAWFLFVFRVGVCLVLLSVLLFLIGFATDHWHKDDPVNYGLWVRCQNGRCQSSTSFNQPAYYIVTQVLQVLAAIAYTVAPILHLVLYCKKKTGSMGCQSRIFDVGFSTGAMLHFVSLTVFGVEHPSPELLSWSYNMSGAGLVMAVIGTLLIMLTKKRVLAGFLKRELRASRIAALTRSTSSNSSRAGTPQSGDTVRKKSGVFGRQHSLQSSASLESHTSLKQHETMFSTPSSRVPYPNYKLPSPWSEPKTDQVKPQIHLRAGPSTIHHGRLGPLRAPPFRTFHAAPLVEDVPV